MKLISIVTPCYNEEQNVAEVYKQVKDVFKKLPKYQYEHIFIDNSSIDRTVDILKGIASTDSSVKIIINARNFGHIRSPYYALLQAKGDAVVLIVSDLQDPPEVINEFIQKWEEGFKIVTGIKNKSKENKLMFLFRKIYYSALKRFSEGEQVKNFTGFGLYDKCFIDVLRTLNDPYPYFRGLITEIGFSRIEVEYVQPKRELGTTKNNFYTLYDIGMLGFVNHSKLPLRLASFIGFIIGTLSLVVALIYFTVKLFFWNTFNLGTAPIIVGLFFFSSVQLFFIGIIGEYIGAIYTQVRKRPLVVEKERINFGENDNESN
jgi:polyisoprenyl-phosphate glycosyltransferase